jgi:hypothetical protein
LSLFLSDGGRHVIGMIPLGSGGCSTLTERSVEVEFRLDDRHFSRSIDRGLSRHDGCPGAVDLRRGDGPLLSTKPSEFGLEAPYPSAQKTKGRIQLTRNETRSSPSLDLFLRPLETEQTPPCISQRTEDRHPPLLCLWDRYIRL